MLTDGAWEEKSEQFGGALLITQTRWQRQGLGHEQSDLFQIGV